jgi:integrase
MIEDEGARWTHVDLEGKLRRALGRAGIVLGYEHVCRVKGGGHSERFSNAVLRKCPKHNHKLWPKALVRPIRFHDLRHTTARAC